MISCGQPLGATDQEGKVDIAPAPLRSAPGAVPSAKPGLASALPQLRSGVSDRCPPPGTLLGLGWGDTPNAGTAH